MKWFTAACVLILSACESVDTTAFDGGWAVVPIDAGRVDSGSGDAGSVDAGGGKVPLYQPCTADEQCESSVCHNFAQVGMLCTKHCVNNSECPAPAERCNAMGLCRPPG